MFIIIQHYCIPSPFPGCNKLFDGDLLTVWFNKMNIIKPNSKFENFVGSILKKIKRVTMTSLACLVAKT